MKLQLSRIKTGAVSLLFLAAYSLSAITPFMSYGVASADGNNGTIKINDSIVYSGQQNEPILSTCELNIKWYGFDEGAQVAKVEFTGQGSTSTDQIVTPSGVQTANFIGSGPGNDLDLSQNYSMSFTGAPGSQGYHVKVSIETTHANNVQKKHKVFWLPASCQEKVSADDVTRFDSCGTKDDTYTIPSTPHVEYYIGQTKQIPGSHPTNGQSEIVVTAKAVDGYALDGQASWTLNFDNEACPELKVPPAPVVLADPCGTKNDTFTVPDVEGVKYYLQSDMNNPLTPGTNSTNGSTSVTIVAVAEDGSGYVSGNTTTLTFTNDPCEEGPVPVQYAIPTVEVVCGPNNDIVTVPANANHITYTYKDWNNGKFKVYAETEPGYYFAGTNHKTKLHWFFHDKNTDCGGGGQGEGQPVTLVEPSVEVVCGPNNDKVTLPEVQNVTYSQTGWVNGKNTVTATVDEGYYITGTEGETTMSWVLTDENTPCGQVLGETTTTPNVPVVATAQLENTGNSIVLPMLLSSGILGLAIMTMMQRSGGRTSKLAAFFQRAADKLYLAMAQPFIVPVA